MAVLWLIVTLVWILTLLEPVSTSYQPVYPTEDDNDTSVDLYLALIMSFGFGGAFNSSGTVPGIQIALDLINNKPNLLPGYKLHYTLMDSQCNHNVALDALFKQIISPVPKVGLMGSGCSVATEPTAEISHYYNITQISCASSSHQLANRDKYKAYFQMLPSAINLVPAIVSVCKQYNWRHVAIIGQDENLFTKTIEELTQRFVSENITWNLKTFKTSDGPVSLGTNLFEERGRIFFLAMYPSQARTVICEAYKIGLVYPRYSFITYGWYAPNWWVPPSTSTLECTRANIASVLHYSIAVLQHQFATNDTELTETGISYEEFEEEYVNRLSELDYFYSRHSLQCFDGMWAFAFALNQTITELSTNTTLNMLAKEIEGISNNESLRIQNVTYKNNIIQQTMFNYLSNTNFLGISGQVSFTSLGTRTVNRLRVFQYRYDDSQDFNAEVIGSVIISHMNFSLKYNSDESDETVWPSGIIPYDGIANNETVSIALPITVIFSTLSVSGIVFALVCLIFIIKYRKSKLVKLTSPKLNFVIIVGAIVMYSSIITYICPTYNQLGSTLLCNIQPRVFSFGYILCFGTILAKMWRVYYVFTNPKPNRKVIKDWHLAIFIIIAVIIELLLIGALTAYPGGRTQAVLIRHKENPTIEKGYLGYMTDYYTYVCDSRDRDIWIGIVFGFKVILQVAALFLAFGIRKVKVKGLNDSKFIAATVYITSIILTVQIIVYITLNDYVNSFSALFSTCIFITSTIVLGLIFIPQMFWVYKDPNGEKIFSNGQAATTRLSLGADNILDDKNCTNDIVNDVFLSDKQKVIKLAQRLKEVEQKLEKDTKTNQKVETEI